MNEWERKDKFWEEFRQSFEKFSFCGVLSLCKCQEKVNNLRTKHKLNIEEDDYNSGAYIVCDDMRLWR